MKFNNKEKLFISALLVLLYLIPAGLEWMQFERANLSLIVISLPIWLLFFFLGPFWLFYLLQKTKLIGNLNVFIQGFIYVLMMFVGAHIVSELHVLAFADYQFPLGEQLVSALLWGVFIFAMTQMYLLYLRLVSERKLKQEAQWMNLTNRLNPHFLFNSLNTISALMHSSPQKADEVLHKLADILRYSVDQQKEWVSLERELSICETYLAIEKARYTDNLIINWQLDEALKPALYKVPPLLLQPLIENVVKHVKSRPIELMIGVHLENDSLIFLVRDNGNGFAESVLSAKTPAGQGLDIVRKRVAIAGGFMQLSNQGGAVCKISLPLQSCA
ncbi:ATPase [Aliidiomarina minuta]|uniref:ATPase n=1 Tax=Aliidiomarina minuta TaxID=880057 RepID=A0A432W9B7_9GAMM|nr:histidine kinase [Aliidiomarina minuta]RUO26576.1 ATPase [Aliidiomarina minuta]